MDISEILIVLILWGLAIAIGSGKASFLIGGYNTSSKSEKEKIDEKSLCKFMSRFLFILGLVQLITPVAYFVGIKDDLNILKYAEAIIFGVVIIVGIAYMNTGNRFKK